MTSCARIAPMLGSGPGELSDEERRLVDEHVAGCAACRARAADLEVVSGLVREALMDEANRRDFATFSDQVLERVGARRRRRLWFAIAAPFAAATAALVLYFATGSSEQHVPLIEVSAEGRGAIVLQTREGPVVLIGAADPEGT